MARRYSDEDRSNALAALAANGGNVERTAKQLRIPETTLRHWARGERHPETAQMGEQKKGPLADAMEEVVFVLVGMMPEKAKDAPLKDIGVTVGIAVDKIRLLRDQPTSISASALTDEQRLQQLQELLDQCRAPLPDGAGVGAGAAPEPAAAPVAAAELPAQQPADQGLRE